MERIEHDESDISRHITEYELEGSLHPTIAGISKSRNKLFEAKAQSSHICAEVCSKNWPSVVTSIRNVEFKVKKYNQ